DKGDAFDMTVGGSAGGLQENAWSWNTVQNGGGGNNSSSNKKPSNESKKSSNDSNQQTGLPNGPWVGGSVSGHDREQDTNATVGEGTITIRNKDQQTQDVAALNRDLSQAQVITKDESYGVEFYASNSGLNAITNPVAYMNRINENFAQQFDQLAALGNNTAAQMREAVRNGSFNEENLRDLERCVGGGTTGFNILEFFSTTAHASVPCYVNIGGKLVPIGTGKDDQDCVRIGREYLAQRANGEREIAAALAYGSAKGNAYSQADLAGQMNVYNTVSGRQSALYNAWTVLTGSGGPAVGTVDSSGNFVPLRDTNGNYTYLGYGGTPVVVDDASRAQAWVTLGGAALGQLATYAGGVYYLGQASKLAQVGEFGTVSGTATGSFAETQWGAWNASATKKDPWSFTGLPGERPTIGAPNSVYLRPAQNGNIVQSTIFDGNGLPVGHIDWKDMTVHTFPPGQPAVGHGAGAPHYNTTDVPAWGPICLRTQIQLVESKIHDSM
ncbi:hypothetical protein WJT86_12195, partial [Microvirga sp. W0021]